jgi:hypothetical protein
MFAGMMATVSGTSREAFTRRLIGEGEIDHIVPLGAFDLTRPEHFVRAAHWTNVRLLSAQENQRKGHTIPEGLDVMSLPWVRTDTALSAAAMFISRQLALLDRMRGAMAAGDETPANTVRGV